MSVDKDTVAKIAHLARIKVPEEKLEPLVGELNNILDWVEMLSEVDTDGVEPLTSVANVTLPLREDKITDGGYRDDILANAPAAEHGFFAVPKVIE
ncbi:Asp-tRNA(Asn)/Glu-tRNA(Gln) amidotransferase subunit GatC [Emcibacter sp.]|uniref:Asp-tRNA(Asn)/Glu-tRNA(Gln) amidotransferase subunit GatC n=1 Tax=Emcibacter sp. TaxID=1979954 RepID=UPI002AA8AC53|nr:Asp-tRNA(Asn)/Glu-tRNA(Gln) amidotransferase subunit GatC [Emcibacter sp.]